MDTILYSYDGSVSQIDRIEFDIWGNKEIKDNSTIGSAAGIDIPDLYDGHDPKRGGLIDPRLGTIGNDTACVWCGCNTTYCPGHFGHIDLADYVLHIGYLQWLHRIISCICPRCSKLIVYKNEEEIKELLRTKNGKERLLYMKALSKNITHCQKPDYGCGTPIPKIHVEQKKSSPTINVIAETDLEVSKDEHGNEGKKKLKQKLTPDILYDILKNISDEDCIVLGMDPKRSRPEDMIHKIFPVPPVQMRPSTKGEFMGGSTMEDDLTHKLADIVKANLRIIKNKENQNEAGSKYNADHAHLLQYHVATYFDNDSLSLPKSEQKGKALKSVSERIKSKEGRIRGNLMGKRGDFTARTVITSDPTIENNQLGVPVKIAMNLTFPEVVTKYNIDYLTELVRRGRDQYPGANYVFPTSNASTGRRVLQIDLRFRKEKVELRYGDIVERHLKDGDIVLLNRQPTLHKQSMMGHRIKVINDPNLLTYRLSVATTTPYNADFDGDEMNIFLAQSLQTQIELEEIAGVERQLITPTTSKAIIGIVQDGLLGAYNLTAPNVRIDWRNAMNLMSYTSIEDFSMFKKDKAYSGQELYSLIIPSGVNIDQKNLKIKNGQILEGQLTNEYLGSKKKNNLIQSIWDGYGVTETKDFIDNTQRLINNFNLYNGFTVGIGDAYIPPNVVDEIDKVYNTKELKVEHLITEMENTPDIMDVDVYESKLCAEIGELRDQINKLVVNNMTPDNKFNIMSSSGSKGSSANMGQISGGLGPQAFEGKSMPKKYNKRTLAYFHQNDDRGASRGLVRRSFIDGLEFPEFVFHLTAGRSGLIDGAIKTAETGYMQRKLVKSMEDIMIKNDGTVRTANDQLLQIVYGDSGSDTTKQYEYMIELISMSNADIANKYKFTDAELKTYKDYSNADNEQHYKDLLELRNVIRKSVRGAKLKFVTLKQDFMLPVNLRRIIDTASSENVSDNTKLDPKYVLAKLNEILVNEMTSLMCVSQEKKNDPSSFKYRDEQVHKLVLRTAIFDALSPKRTIVERKLNKTQFDTIVTNIIAAFNKNMIEPGEMAGIIAAQSMGEQLTQFTLNSFHHAGIASMSAATHGVPRIKEILSVSKSQKTPQMIVYLTDEFKTNRDMSYKIASHIKYTTLGSVRDRIDVYYDPDPKAKGGIMEQDNVKHIFYNHAGGKTSCQGDVNGLPWLLRIKMNREKMLEKEVTLLEIKSKFCSWWEKRFVDAKTMKKEEKKVINKITQIAVLSNSDNDAQPCIHIRFNVKDADKDKDQFRLETINNFIDFIIDKFKLKGVASVTDIPAIVEERVINFNETTGEIEKNNQYVIYTAGVNMIDIRYFVGIDILNTISNDVVDAYNTFGIEVARTILLKEITSAYDGAGGEVNYQHISLIVDLMTSSGFITSIDRHGMNKSDNDPLSRASFEKSVDQLLTAAVFGEVDHMKGISSRIMAGAVIKGGTGYCDVTLDTEMIEKSEFSEDAGYSRVFTELAPSTIATEINTKKHGIFVPV